MTTDRIQQKPTRREDKVAVILSILFLPYFLLKPSSDPYFLVIEEDQFERRERERERADSFSPLLVLLVRKPKQS